MRGHSAESGSEHNGGRAARPALFRLTQPRPRTMATIFSPHSVGFCDTWTPAADRAFILGLDGAEAAEIMAAAGPLLRPGGAVTPAMYAATGFVMLDAMKSAARSSSEPPISPIIM